MQRVPLTATGKDTGAPSLSLRFLERQGGGFEMFPTLPAPLPFQKGPLLQFRESLLQLFLSIHDNRPIPCDRLLKWLSRNQQKPDSVIPGLHRDLVPAIE